MPTYEYDCARCGTVEVFQSMRDDPLTVCPDCGSKRFQRMISGGAGVIFRGSGFYETDYNRSGDYAKAAKSESGTGSGEGGAKTGDADSAVKPAGDSAAAGSKKSSNSGSDAKSKGSGSAASRSRSEGSSS